MRDSHLISRTYIVGGMVRDTLMGIPSNDMDLVIENTTPEEFEGVYPEYKKVGNSFPVYLDESDNEIALARREFKSGDKYQDFEVETNVSIESDLFRRDITINSMAIKLDSRELVDPYGGKQDIENKILRAVNPHAFQEDPLRIYRICRFYVRFEDFTVDENTKQMMKDNIQNLKFVTPERVAVELEKMYKQSSKPSRFFELLHEIDGLKIHFKPLHLLTKIGAGGVKFGRSNTLTAFNHVMEAIDRCKANDYSYDVFCAVLNHDNGKGITKKANSFEEQKHVGHDFKSYIINKKYVNQHRFTAKQNELIISFGLHHMYFHDLTKVKKSVKLIRFYKKIKKYETEFIQAANCDHELSEEQLKILSDLRRTFKETVIDIPKEIQKKGRDSIVNFVEQKYAEKYKEIVDSK